ncbi:uncharacterized protein E0L32_009506 [Thyridium curvatum]|uniref:Histone deacetylase interacting domain-containing protein n=1 Tax=Thyridium curvatum TaxID=1093900 RepID=A0A507AS15_9PEZI|nr:uncharacterized protein E0L32_009506 [Thyridium curvatum]TPX09314.1 hypothetical protein E0L32_009506 [Thyridium curvatum]
MNGQPMHGAGFDRDRDRDREIEEQRHRALQQQDEMAHREREREREQYPPGAPPHHSSAGSIPIHQPVASRIPGAIHSPGGLLANHGGGPNIPLGPPSGPPPPAANFGPPLSNESSRQMQHGGQAGPPPSQQHMFAPMPHGPVPPSNSLGASNGPGAAFGGPPQPEHGRGVQQIPFGGSNVPPAPQGPNGQGGLSQGQQPILNDALSYLDQVKVQFHEQPDVYNRFLDIMKDFKSQTIDTPGVISRVSDLFAGHPNLIQGFNTFLPPGYRIECGLENNPNSIRVTTPSGSTIHSIGPARNLQAEGTQGPPGPSQPYMGQQRPANWQVPMQHSVESPEAQFSAPVHGGPGPHPNPVPRNAHTPTPSAAQGALNGNAAQQANMDAKRGPVEFNHAISYVNKIKNRFQDKPEIYKQFLEILQTYQREQKPIQEVYAQVTTLFNSAPDLLEDFKQFLPESAAHARAAAAGRPSEEGLPQSSTPQSAQPSHLGRDFSKGPPVGTFAPPSSASKESKKRPKTEKQAPVPPPVLEPMNSSVRNTLPGGSGSNKRAKLSHKPTAEGPSIEPTLTPVMPEPLAGSAYTDDVTEALNFFDKVKKYVNNRTTTIEFQKLLNLYTSDLISLNDLVTKAYHFIGGNPELFTYFKSMVGYTGDDEQIKNTPLPPDERVSLSNCRGYGPSYRLLPKRERLKPCSGRDELCRSVLNDAWASHPTWASEDSGFVAHRKNAFEEGLHRIEEERHDYDFHIELNQKCIQLLEPIAQQMLTMTPEERKHFRMPPGLGGQSTSIYKRVFKKIYGLEHGPKVTNELFMDPFVVVPVVLARMRQKDEEWRFSQREWEKIWLAQTEAMHLKSLDHMGIQVKSNDKRMFSAKHLVDLIKTKHEELRRARALKLKSTRHQFLWTFPDQDLLLDLLRFMVLYVMHSGQHGAAEKERILDFFETFVPQFFDLPEDQVQQRLADIDRDSGEEDEDPTPAELVNGRSRRNGKKSDLLRGVLDPGRNSSKSRNQKEGSAASGSKETTPDNGSANEEEMADAPEETAVPDVSNERWLPTVPRPTVIAGENPFLDSDNELKADGFFPRTWYNFFCNQSIYIFFFVFHALYQRLKDVKENKKTVLEEIERASAETPAKKLNMVSSEPKYFEDINTDTFWPRTIELIEDFIAGDLDESSYQDVLRHYYLTTGWKLYSMPDLLRILCRQALSCNNSDSKEKTAELVTQFLNNRQQEETSYQTEISARKFAEKCVKDGDMFNLCLVPSKNEVSVRWLPKNEATFSTDEMEIRERWKYYISSYVRVDPTEGVARSRLQTSVLNRNLPKAGSDHDSEDEGAPKPLVYNEGLVLRICLNSSKIAYEKGTAEHFIYGQPRESEDAKRLDARRHDRRMDRFQEKFVMNTSWMRDMPADGVQKRKEAFQKWLDDGVLPTEQQQQQQRGASSSAAASAPAAAVPAGGAEDVEME